MSGAGPSFYAISGLVPGTAYVARLAPIEELLAVQIFRGVGFEGEVEINGVPVLPGAPFEHTFAATDTTGYMKVALPLGADGLGTFELDVSPQE